jgi:hypothetical protein
MVSDREGLNGGKVKFLMEQEDLKNTTIMVKKKVFVESIIVTPKNAILLVLVMKLLHLGG